MGVMASARDVAVLYDVISRLSVPEEKAFLRHLSSEMKIALWQLHTRRFLEDHPELTDEQRTAIEDGIASIHEWFERDEETAAAREGFRQRIESLLPPELVYRLYYSLGGRTRVLPPRP